MIVGLRHASIWAAPTVWETHLTWALGKDIELKTQLNALHDEAEPVTTWTLEQWDKQGERAVNVRSEAWPQASLEAVLAGEIPNPLEATVAVATLRDFEDELLAPARLLALRWLEDVRRMRDWRARVELEQALERQLNADVSLALL